MRSKKECRKEALARRALMSAKEREAAGRRITDFLRDSEEYQLAEKILVYASYRDEVPTYDLMEGALREGKQVFCPKIEGQAGARTMSFYRIMDPEELQDGFQGIPEPVVLQGRHYETGKNSRDLILMPALLLTGKGGGSDMEAVFMTGSAGGRRARQELRSVLTASCWKSCPRRKQI